MMKSLYQQLDLLSLITFPHKAFIYKFSFPDDCTFILTAPDPIKRVV
jgi:hypothetical protein